MKNNKKHILVTGGAGFIGSHVNKLLHQSGYQTVVLDNLSHGQRENVTYGHFVQGDIGDAQLLDKLFKSYSIEGVMHFAAWIDVGESVKDPLKYYDNNVVKTLTLLNAMRHHQINHFVFSSTAAVYGLTERQNVIETDPCYPINPYGQSKLMVENILRDLDIAYGLRSCCLRYFNAAGGDPEAKISIKKCNDSNLIPRVLEAASKPGASITIFGTDYPTQDGTCIRDYIHVMDLASAHLLAMEQLLQGAPSACYNLGNGQGFSVRQVIEATEKVIGIKIPFKEGARRAGDPAILIANAEKAAVELRWKQSYPALEIIIDHAWKNYARVSGISA